MKIGDALREVSREKRIDSNTKYKLLGVKWYGKGVFLREEKYGREIKATKLYQAKNGDFIYNRLFAWKSSFALVPEEFNDCFVSNEFPLFICNTDKIVPEFLLNYILLPQNINSINNLSGGMSGISRKRFKEAEFLNFDIPEIKVEMQRNTCNKIQQVSKIMSAQELESINQISFIGQLRQTIFQEAIQGKLTAKWRKEHPELISGDNSALKLLERIKAEKENLSKEGKLKKEKPLPLITDKEKPFDLPDGWVWCRLNDVVNFDTGKLDSNAAIDGGIYPFFTCSKDPLAINNYGFDCEAVLLAGNNAAGKYNVKYFKGKFNAYQRTYVLTTNQSSLGGLNYRFLKILLEYSLEDLRDKSLGSLTQYLTLGILKSLIITFPPVSEQLAIVERLNKLMIIIDELEQQVLKSKERSEMLMHTVLREAFVDI